jgi:FkbM family methyltransferase
MRNSDLTAQNKQFSIDSITSDWPETKSEEAKKLCSAFLEAPVSKRFVFGQNVYTKAITSVVPVSAVVDDYTQNADFNGIPILRLKNIPHDAFVLSTAGGRPLTVRRMLEERQVRNIDYFKFRRWSGLDLPEAVFNEDFQYYLQRDKDKLEWLFSILEDDESRKTLSKLMMFRASYDLDYLEGFSERQECQYFEDFMRLDEGKQVFVDIGGFDGATAEEFIRRCPSYDSIYVLEPEPINFRRCQEKLAGRRDLVVLPYGAGDENVSLKFSSQGSASRLSDDGEITVEVRLLDELIQVKPTFIKMDIEGAELKALKGATRSITEHGPTLAICVYHRPTDFWEIPKAVLALHSEYRVFIRHYTECIYETVMYFVPK